jgi:hypothetical protein
MLFALSAASALLDGLQSLTSSSSAGQSGTAFDPADGTADAGSSATAVGGCGAQISPQTMSALLDAQGQSASTSADESDSADGSSSDPLMQLLDASNSSSVTNSDGSTTTTITYADGSTATMTSPAASTSSGTGSAASNSAISSYNQIDQMIQQQAQALTMQAGSTLSMAA